MATAQTGGRQVSAQAPIAQTESLLGALERHDIGHVQENSPPGPVAYSSEHFDLLLCHRAGRIASRPVMFLDQMR
jgi:hypothetical protein